MKFSSEIEVFKRSSEIGFFQDSGPLGYGRLEKCALSAGKTYVHKILLLVGGLGFGEGGSADFIFLWA